MDLNLYQQKAVTTAVFDQEWADIYCAGKLVAEAGELANIVFRRLREGHLYPEKVHDELGDVLWYVSMLAHVFGFSLDSVALANLEKLAERKEKGTLADRDVVDGGVHIVQEELWDWDADIVVVTTNSYIRTDGTLTMGRGAAKQAVHNLDNIAAECGAVVTSVLAAQLSGIYGFRLIRGPSEKRLGFGIFQVKKLFQNPADLGIIQSSVRGLRTFAEAHPQYKIRMNYPGIGLGLLKRVTVEPFLKVLPSNVTVCYK